MSLLNEEHGRYKTFSRRALLLGGGQLLLFGGLAARLYELQIVENERYATLAEENRVSLRLLAPPRGRILDRYGTPVAVNEHNYRVMLVAEQAADIERTLDRLSRIVQLSEAEKRRILDDVHAKRPFVPVKVAENLSWETVSRIEVNAPRLPGVNIDVGQTRAYPHGAALSHVLGYVGAVDKKDMRKDDPLLEVPGFFVGKTGLEKQYDTALRGEAGTSQVEVNAVGRTIRELDRDPGKPGHDLVTTLDTELQKRAHARISNARSASTVILDVSTGDVLALASTPSFDNNTFALGISEQRWRELTRNPYDPLANKATTGAYNPGSTFKMVVAAAAMANGVAPDHEVHCPGYYDLGDARFHCWAQWGHGKLDMVGGFKHSCDVYFYDLARRVGIDAIAETARQFGMGAPLGIDLPGEAGGTMPTKDWKNRKLGEPWQLGETLVCGIGQGYVLSTPLQLAVMTARIATGRAVAPRIGRRLVAEQRENQSFAPESFEKMGVREEHLEVLRTGMDAVVNSRGGTAHSARLRELDADMAGKTGTSQVRRISAEERREGVTDNADLPWRKRDHALFVGYAPVKAPRYCAATVVEHGGAGSKAAAPIVHDLLRETLQRDPATRGDLRLSGRGRGRTG
ncbi:peptidoglycan glycosyltransferase [Limimonas halophila]|uniref:Peptidoglycan glycosyltransferase n=1 Tax=Limimonas halophila TaxID=1082479 RepID=A0A1G7L1C1_9PROT|nr:penicillin-binding protein 2 [Limimonas halophila]SDF43278.1 peptidoglycan glycosyltransferase [Limimonas halophila]